MVEDAVEAVLEVRLVRRPDAVPFPGHLSDQGCGLWIDRHGVLDGARPVVRRLVLFVEPLQHHRSADVKRHRGVRIESVLGREAGFHQVADRRFHLLGTHSRSFGTQSGADENQIAQNRIAHERLTHQARVVAQRLAPIAGFHVRGGEDVLAQGPVGHRVEQIVLLAEVPVDAGDADAQVFAEQRHAQVVYRHLLREFECATDDVIRIDGSAFAALTLVGSCLLCHYGHLHQGVCCACGRWPFRPSVVFFVRFSVCYCNTYRRVSGKYGWTGVLSHGSRAGKCCGGGGRWQSRDGLCRGPMLRRGRRPGSGDRPHASRSRERCRGVDPSG